MRKTEKFNPVAYGRWAQNDKIFFSKKLYFVTFRTVVTQPSLCRLARIVGQYDIWTSPDTVDKFRPHNEARSNASGLP